MTLSFGLLHRKTAFIFTRYIKEHKKFLTLRQLVSGKLSEVILFSRNTSYLNIMHFPRISKASLFHSKQTVGTTGEEDKTNPCVSASLQKYH